MFFSLNQLLFSAFDIICGGCHMLIESPKFLALSLHFDINIFSDGVDILHNRFDLVDILLSLLDDLLHVIGLSYDFELLLLLHLHLDGLSFVVCVAVLTKGIKREDIKYLSRLVARSMKSCLFSLIC